MANRHRGEVDVELGGKIRQLRFTFHALALVEEKLGLTSIEEVFPRLQAKSLRVVITLLWAGLIHDEPELTEREVGEMDFDLSAAMLAAGEALALCFRGSIPATDAAGQGAAEGNARPRGRGTGKRP